MKLLTMVIVIGAFFGCEERSNVVQEPSRELAADFDPDLDGAAAISEALMTPIPAVRFDVATLQQGFDFVTSNYQSLKIHDGKPRIRFAFEVPNEVKLRTISIDREMMPFIDVLSRIADAAGSELEVLDGWVVLSAP